LEASALTHASRLGLLGRRSPLLRLQGDERLIALIRDGQERAFDTLFERYQARLLAFCRGMLASAEDAEDVLQEVFVAAHKAILADNRAINARPWLYRIARNRCLNHLRKPVPEGQDSMDVHPHENGVSVAERVQKREEFRALIADVQDLPETQRTALLLREIDALAYEEIAVAMDTTVPAIKSLLVRARMSLADCSQGRHLTCDEVHLELAEATEGLRKASGPARAHLRGCESCRAYRKELRRNGKALAALAPIGPLAALHAFLTAAGTGTAAVTGAAAAGGGGMTLAGGAAVGGLGGALGTKAAAGVASMALITAGAVEVNDYYQRTNPNAGPAVERSSPLAMAGPAVRGTDHVGHAAGADKPAAEANAVEVEQPVAPPPEAPAEEAAPAPAEEPPADAVVGGAEAGTGHAEGTLTHDADPTHPAPTEPAPEDPPPAEEPPPVGGEPAPPAEDPVWP
jgi:RNA polymerase sigma factor (sigma-70 family)